VSKDFDTRKEAEDYIKEIQRGDQRFCPLIVGTCDVACICYYKHHISDKPINVNGSLKFRVYGGECQNAMFHSWYPE